MSGQEDVDALLVPVPNPGDVETLRLSDCGLTEIPNVIRTFTNLHTLRLPTNEVTAVPSRLSERRHLKLLPLRGNPVTDEQQAHIRALLPQADVEF